MQEYGIDADHIRQDDLTLLNYLVQHGNSTFMSNYINIFMYSYGLIPSYIIFRQLIKVSYKEKKNSRYFLAGIRKFCPETLEIPL